MRLCLRAKPLRGGRGLLTVNLIRSEVGARQMRGEDNLEGEDEGLSDEDDYEEYEELVRPPPHGEKAH